MDNINNDNSTSNNNDERYDRSCRIIIGILITVILALAVFIVVIGIRSQFKHTITCGQIEATTAEQADSVESEDYVINARSFKFNPSNAAANNIVIMKDDINGANPKIPTGDITTASDDAGSSTDSLQEIDAASDASMNIDAVIIGMYIIFIITLC